MTEPVYNTATGRYLLIPQGSRIFGKYNSQIAYGQSRVQVVWTRVIIAGRDSLQDSVSQAGQEMTRLNLNSDAGLVDATAVSSGHSIGRRVDKAPNLH